MSASGRASLSANCVGPPVAVWHTPRDSAWPGCNRDISGERSLAAVERNGKNLGRLQIRLESLLADVDPVGGDDLDIPRPSPETTRVAPPPPRLSVSGPGATGTARRDRTIDNGTRSLSVSRDGT